MEPQRHRPRPLTRRGFLKLAGTATGGLALGPGLAACARRGPAPAGALPVGEPSATREPAPAPEAAPSAGPGLLAFPAGFLWGAATSAYQIEGAVREDGRGESIWDRFSHTPGKVAGGDTGDVACDHYHRYEQDLDLMAQLGLKSYRFSIAWPRVMPAGAGPVNQKGLDFYKRLIEGLHRRGIVPNATLYHWDLPQALQDQGGWQNRDTAHRFAEYAEAIWRALGDAVPMWATHNEPFIIGFLGHAWGNHAPGLKDYPAAVKVVHHVLYSHGLAVQAFRALAPKGAGVGIVLDFWPAYPASESAEDREAARRQDGFRHRWCLEPLLKGSYPADLVPWFERQWGPLDYVQPNDLKLAASPIDFMGINYYSRNWIAADPRSPFFGLRQLPPRGQVTAMGWEVAPDAFYDLLVRLRDDAPGLPLYITENGASYTDARGSGGQVQDPGRLAYIRDHLAAVQRAIAAGADVRGYYAWSLLDNFEWALGYAMRFGIVHVDFTTQERTPKQSALWYRDVIARNGLAPAAG